MKTNYNKTIMTSILIAAIAALMIPSTAFAGFPNPNEGGIGGIKNLPGFLPDPNGNGRAMAYDGLTTLFYTFVGDTNIYMVSTAGVSLGAIPNPTPRTFTCGALDMVGTNLVCGTYDGTGDYWLIDPATGLTVGVVPIFNSAAFGGFGGNAGNCFAQAPNFIDGVAFDSSDGTYWTSDDGGTTLFHITAAGGLIGSTSVPMRTGSAFAGCNSGITVSGNFLELVLLAFEADGNSVSHEIVKVSKADPTTVIIAFTTASAICCEDIALDANTFIPRVVVWANGPNNVILAYDVQVTRTIGFWKNHSDLAEGLPIDLGDNDQNGVCMIVVDADDVETVMKDHKGKAIIPKLKAQLLAAKLNVELGDIPPGDLAAITIVIDAADALIGLNGCDPKLSKFGATLAEARALHSALDAFNNLYSP